ncbi:MAG: murein biosynthesis integral membrane protein MurJ [Acidimicrobiales bacterium]|nr:murein biosynthesis integral membrane protein MurJ [Acidimicrobiales bacterium]
MAASTVASRVTGFGRVLALAYALSFTRLSDAYNLANTTPNIVYTLVLGGVLAATLVPVFVETLANARTEEDAWHALSAVVTIATITLIAVSAMLALAAPDIVKIYSFRLHGVAASDQRAVAGTLLRLFAPQVAFYGVITLCTALLNAKRRFVAPMITPVLNNLVVIGVLLATPHVAGSLAIGTLRHDNAALLLLGAGTTAGVAVQAAALVVAMRGAGVRVRPVWAPRHAVVQQVLRLSGWTIGYVAINQIGLWVVLALANGEAGDVSAYQAAYTFFQLPYAIVAVTAITILVPELARRWIKADVAAFREVVSHGLRMIVFLVLPGAIGYAAFGTQVVRATLEHGAFSPASATRTGGVLGWMALGLPAFASYLFLMSAYQAMQNTRTMFLIYCAENAANIVFAVVLYPSMGARGLALAFAAAYVVGCGAAFADMRRRVGPLDLLLPTGRIALAGGAAALAGWLTLFVGFHDDSSVPGSAAAAVIGGGVYLVAARRLGVSELQDVVALIRRKAAAHTP